MLATPIHAYNVLTGYMLQPITRFTVRLATAPSNPIISMCRQRRLEVYLDADLSMTVHVTPTVTA